MDKLYYIFKNYDDEYILRHKKPRQGYKTIKKSPRVKEILPCEVMEKALSAGGHISIRIERSN